MVDVAEPINGKMTATERYSKRKKVGSIAQLLVCADVTIVVIITDTVNVFPCLINTLHLKKCILYIYYYATFFARNLYFTLAMTASKDRDLLLRACRSDAEAYGELVTCYQTSVFNVCDVLFEILVRTLNNPGTNVLV